MKNALILHGTDGTPEHNWFPWLKGVLEARGYAVFLPQLPEAERPDIDRYNAFLLSSDFDFNGSTLIVGHSSGAVAILGLLEALPEGTVIDTAVLVGAFRGHLDREELSGMDKPFDFTKIKRSAKRIVLIHSDNDPYCPLEHAEYLANELGAELILEKGQAHFSVGTAGEQYRQFPLLLSILRLS